MRWRFGLIATALVFTPAVVHGGPGYRVEHEPIAADPANDVAFGLQLDGDLPAAISTPSGLATAPDPRAPLPTSVPPTTSPSLAGQPTGPGGPSRFTPDTDTRRPGALPYSDPFIPSTAPWKRLVAYDSVLADFSLGVLTPALTPVPQHARGRTDGSEELFYGDLVVDLRPNEPTRIPSVGPGARVVHARLGVGADDIDFELLQDSAENWFVRSHARGPARLVMELTIARATFGGVFGDVAQDMRFLRWGSPLPEALQRDVDVVTAHVGVPKATPRDTLLALVDYFRGFEESSEPLPALPVTRSVYLALAMSKKGVCRHRAYAFMVTATALGIRTRAVMNEAHAWVEVESEHLWKRIDLGGAGTILDESPAAQEPKYSPPPDPFDWPAGAKRGEDLARTATTSSTGPGTNAGGPGASPGQSAPTLTGSAGAAVQTMSPDDRPRTDVTLETTQGSASRGQPVDVHGRLVAEGRPCAHALVTVSVRDAKTGHLSPLGTLATDGAGAYAGSVVIPRSVGVGDYDVVASTSGDSRCGAGVSDGSP